MACPLSLGRKGAVGGWRCLPEGHRLYRLSSAISSLAAGIRGGIFTLVFARLNIRLRNCLFRSLVSQETSFFDENRTGWSLLGTLGVQGELASCGALTAAWLTTPARRPVVQFRVDPWDTKLPGDIFGVSWEHHGTLAGPLEVLCSDQSLSCLVKTQGPVLPKGEAHRGPVPVDQVMGEAAGRE